MGVVKPSSSRKRTSRPDMSVAIADQVVAETVKAARAVFGAEIEAVYALGSLAHGGFSPLVSDVDVAIVLGSTGPETADLIRTVQRLVLARASTPLAERLSVFWADWHAVRTGDGGHFRLGPIDRLDLLDSGRLLLGTDLREPSVRPSHQDLVLMSADFILSKFTEHYLARLRDAEGVVAGGPHAVTKAVLFPVRFMYTLRTGRIGLNDGSARWYAAEGLPGSALALNALKCRNDGIGDVDRAAQRIEADLANLHAECLSEYAKHLDGLGEAPRAAALAERAGCVNLLAPDAR